MTWRRGSQPVEPVLIVEAHRGQGGPPTTVRDLAPALQELRPVLVAIPDGVVRRQLGAGAPPVPTVKLPWSGRRWWDRLQALPILAWVLWRLGPSTIVHANGKSALNLAAPSARLIRLQPEVFVHFHDSELDAGAARMFRVWGRLGVRIVVAPVSQQASSHLIEHGLGHLVKGALANPISPPARRIAHDPRTSGQPFRVAAVVSRQPRKGLDIVIECASLLADREVVFHVYGVGRDTPRNAFLDECFQRRIDLGLTERVRLRGRVEHLGEHLRGHDCLLVTSRRESFCRVAVEGMAAGLPVVAPHIAGLVEAVGDGNCTMYEPGDPQAAADAIARLADDPEAVERYRVAGAARARRFMPPRVCQELDSLYVAHGLATRAADRGRRSTSGDSNHATTISE